MRYDVHFKCEICGEMRPDALISVCTTDVSKKYGLPEGSAKLHMNYCNDNATCEAAVIKKATISLEINEDP